MISIDHRTLRGSPKRRTTQNTSLLWLMCELFANAPGSKTIIFFNLCFICGWCLVSSRGKYFAGTLQGGMNWTLEFTLGQTNIPVRVDVKKHGESGKPVRSRNGNVPRLSRGPKNMVICCQKRRIMELELLGWTLLIFILKQLPTPGNIQIWFDLWECVKPSTLSSKTPGSFTTSPSDCEPHYPRYWLNLINPFSPIPKWIDPIAAERLVPEVNHGWI